MTGEEIKEQVYDAVACDDMFYRPELRDAIYDMVDENAKLRELCRDLFDRLMDKDEICGECRSSCEYDAWNFGIDGCIYKRRMDELGVEVDDGTE